VILKWCNSRDVAVEIIIATAETKPVALVMLLLLMIFEGLFFQMFVHIVSMWI